MSTHSFSNIENPPDLVKIEQALHGAMPHGSLLVTRDHDIYRSNLAGGSF